MSITIKTLVITFSAGILSLSGISCKKCISCSYKGSNSTYNSGEICDRKSVIDATIKDCETKAKTVGVTCSCR